MTDADERIVSACRTFASRWGRAGTKSRTKMTLDLVVEILKVYGSS